MSEQKKIALSLIAGLLLSGVALYITFRGVPLLELATYLKSVNYWWVLLGMVIALASFLIRVVRWQFILNPVKSTHFWNAYHPLMMGFMFNCILPGRVGELARPAIFHRREKVDFIKVLATVGAERVFDVVVLLLSLVIVLAAVEISPTLDLTFRDYHINKSTLEMIGMTTLKIALALVAGIVLVRVDKSRKVINQIILNLPWLLLFAGTSFKEHIREQYCVKLISIVDNVAAGLGLMKSPKKVLSCLGLSFLVWIVSGVSYYVMTFGYPGIKLSFAEIYAMMIIICLFISLPSAPGFWGLWEAGGVFGLLIFGVPAKEAAGFTLTNHVFQLFPVIAAGLVSSTVTGISIGQVARTGLGNKPREKADNTCSTETAATPRNRTSESTLESPPG